MCYDGDLSDSNRFVAGRQVAKLDFNWIVPNLAQGSYPDVREAFKTFDIIVFCAEEKQPRTRAPKGKHIARFPLDDDPYRPLPVEVAQMAHQLARNIGSLYARGHPVLITCAQGLNRSGLITALILMYCHRMPARDAIQLIRRQRDKDALCNPMFEQFLMATTPAA